MVHITLIWNTMILCLSLIGLQRSSITGGLSFVIWLPVNTFIKLEDWRWYHLPIHSVMIWIYMSSPRISSKKSCIVLASDWPALLRTYTLYKKIIHSSQQMSFLHCVLGDRVCVCIIHVCSCVCRGWACTCRGQELISVV